MPTNDPKARAYRELRLWQKAFFASLQGTANIVNAACLPVGDILQRAEHIADEAVEAVNYKRERLLGSLDEDQQFPELEPE